MLNETFPVIFKHRATKNVSFCQQFFFILLHVSKRLKFRAKNDWKCCKITLKIEYDQNAVTIASAVVSLGKSLGLEIIAEGVETKEQARELMKMGCIQAQGYYYGRPVEAAVFNSQHLKKQAAKHA